MHTPLPTSSRTTRINALAAALVVTLAMLAGIGQLADAERAPLLAGAAASQQA